jgi:hypothetical protein
MDKARVGAERVERGMTGRDLEEMYDPFLVPGEPQAVGHARLRASQPQIVDLRRGKHVVYDDEPRLLEVLDLSVG